MAILEPHRPRTKPAVAALALLLLGSLGVSVAVARPVPTVPNHTALPGVKVTAPESTPSIGPVALAITTQEHACQVRGLSGNFSGTMSHSSDGDGERDELSGWHNGDQTIQRYVDGLRLCMRLHGEVVMADNGMSVRAVGQDSWVVMESEGDGTQRLEITEGPGGIEHAWSVDGRSLSFGQDAQEWRDRVFTVLGGLWEASSIRGEQSSLRGQISSHRGQVSSLRGQMSSYRGQVSSLKGQISSYRGQVSSLRGQISSHRGRISSLKSAARATSDPETQDRLEREIEGQEQRIREVEQQIAEYDVETRVAEVEGQIEDYDLEQRLSEVEAQLAQFDVEAKIREVEAQIEAFDLDSKVREIEERWTPSFGQVCVAAKVESGFMIQAALGLRDTGRSPGLLSSAPSSMYASSGVRSWSDECGRHSL